MKRYGLSGLVLVCALSACAMDLEEGSPADGDDSGEAIADPSADPSAEPDAAGEPLLISPSTALAPQADGLTAQDGPKADAGCVYIDTGAWGCHSSTWCDTICRYRDYRYGFAGWCVWRTNHWETYCGCCD
jgi:hypothetical protein